MCGFYGIAFIECMLAGKTLLDYSNLFFTDGYKKNGKTIYKYCKDKYVSIFAFPSLVCVFVGIPSSVVRIKICAITAGIKKYKSIIKKS